MLPEAGVAISTLGQFRVWLEGGAPGSAFPYYVGFLAQARGLYPSYRQEEDMLLAAEAWAEHERGTVELLQLKVRSGKYVYFAVKRKRRVKR